MAITTISAATTVEETGIRRNLLEDLALKVLYLVGEMSLHEISRHMGLSYSIVDELYQRLRSEQLCQVTGMEKLEVRITTTSAGK